MGFKLQFGSLGSMLSHESLGSMLSQLSQFGSLGSMLSQFFTVVVDIVTKFARGGVKCCMLMA